MAEFAMIQTYKTLLYVSGISVFFNFSIVEGVAYSILLGKSREGHLLGQGHLLGRIQYLTFHSLF